MINKHIKCEKGINVTLISTNARYIELGPVVNRYLNYENGEICNIDYPSFKLSLKETLVINNEKFKVQKIKLKKTDYFNKLFLYSSVFSRSSNFITPLIVKTKNEVSFDKYFMNCYVGNELTGDYGKFIYIHLRYKPIIELEEVEKKLVDNENFIESKNTDKQYTLYKFKVPEEFLNDYNLIISGKYSQISDNAKLRILSFHNATKTSKIFQILYKKEELRMFLENELQEKLPKNAELHGLMIPEEETFLKDYIL